MAGIDKTIETFSDLGKLSSDLIAIVKAGGFKLSVLPSILDLAKQVGELVADAPSAIPELKDLDAAEAAQVGAAAFELVKSLISALSAV